MANKLQVGDLVANPGEVKRGYIDVDGLPESASMPVTLINGLKPGPRLTVIAGIHGFEYGGIAASIEMSTEADPEDLAGQLVIAPIVNRPAFEQRSIYVCPLDGKNLNRVFPGDPEGTASERIASTIYNELILGSDAVLDLHAGDAIETLVPFSIYHITKNAAVDDRSVNLARNFGLRYLLGSAVQGSTHQVAAEAGIPAIIAEIGGQGVYSKEIADRHYDGIKNVMRSLGMIDQRPLKYEDPHLFYGFAWAWSDSDATWHPEVGVGETVTRGAKIGELRTYFGEPIKEVTAPASGLVVFLVTSLAIRAGDPLLGIADPEAEKP